jgi:hypothetical protein
LEGVTIAANRQSPPRRWHLPVTRLRSASPGGMEPNCKANRNKKRKSQGNQPKQGVKISCRTASALVVVLVCISHTPKQPLARGGFLGDERSSDPPSFELAGRLRLSKPTNMDAAVESGSGTCNGTATHSSCWRGLSKIHH